MHRLINCLGEIDHYQWAPRPYQDLWDLGVQIKPYIEGLKHGWKIFPIVDFVKGKFGERFVVKYTSHPF